MARTKRARMQYTSYQLGILENRFNWNQYASFSERSLLAKQLQLSEKQVKVWFQNRRSKDRQKQKVEGTTPDEQKLLPDGGPGGSPVDELFYYTRPRKRAASNDGTPVWLGQTAWLQDIESPSDRGCYHSQDKGGQIP
jgi:hypothetical protein